MGIAWEEYEDMRDGCAYLVVADVVPGSAASELRLSVGSVLQTLNGMQVSQLPWEDLPQWLSQCRPLQLGFSAPVEEGAVGAGAAEVSGSSPRMLSPRRQSRETYATPGQPAALQPAPERNAFSARAWAPTEQVVNSVGLDSPAAARACVAVAAGAPERSGAEGYTQEFAPRRPMSPLVQHVPRPPGKPRAASRG